MNISIKFDGKITEDDSFQLNQLAEQIEQECLVSVQVEKDKPQPGVKSDGFSIGLVISLGLSTVSTFIALLAYWQSRHPRYSVSLTQGDVTFKIDNIPPDKLQNAISKLKAQDTSHTEVVISRQDDNQ